MEMPIFMAFDGTRATFAGRLIDFQTRKSELLPEHRRWLQEMIVPAILTRPNAWIDVYGYASKRGNQHDNLVLSRARAGAVKDFLSQELAIQGRNIEGIINIGCGFEETAPGYSPDSSDNVGYWRAAEIVLFETRPKIVRPPMVTPVHGNTFEIRVVGRKSASRFFQPYNHIFQIIDKSHGQTAFFSYTGSKRGISFPKIPDPASVATSAPLTLFRTSRPTKLDQFNSKASLYQDPGTLFGPFSKGGTLRLILTEIHDASGLIFTDPRIIPIKGSGGMQAPVLGSATQGVLSTVSDIFPYP